MDFSTVVTISALLVVVTAAAEAETVELESNIANITTAPNRTTRISYDDADPAPTNSAGSSSNNNRESPQLTPILGFLAVNWTSKCHGHLIFYHHSMSSHVCHDSKAAAQRLSPNVCENRKGCKDQPRWYGGSNMPNGYQVSEDGGNMPNGYQVSEDGEHQSSSCEVLEVQCAVETDKAVSDVHGQELKVYKVMTALLCCVLLVLLLMRFTKPTIKALQKRLSDRRQNRWIGPTQSHSVSYQRGKSAVKNNNREQRLSYPALERLTLSDSREPSSNRNSDYNL